jgi:hypothetical protein
VVVRLRRAGREQRWRYGRSSSPTRLSRAAS